jgi:Fe2+ transport system protein FeoA
MFLKEKAELISGQLLMRSGRTLSMIDIGPNMSPMPKTPICLCDLAVGATARFHDATLDADFSRVLRAVGLTQTSELRLCKNGDPCIVQVRATRIGLSRAVAGQVFVVPTTTPGT